ncbi:MAG: guanylate kinase [Deltaproteobacteria bacterium RIFCSPLOWO2_12_FULL_43_16]|nr:MAG: guanylate kinase [Deltaproteobacteria bacterium GWA2_43_19]OGQ09398.1 MAG: guanylate kinase [Deltaproteobacteria bacterium RIFCSPHIGHO2_02_FULL_43_33]OGQ34884.1 MAG: guanylate kinase [Deltaproteobacteria bacterium RIFCSPLOWO2_01_FULL_42_9]OGQ58627.1 MAG: guanylate kinase [Deltaproteobacteria bacterium RIFCSPLOWO2_12_FULL_43_16]
MNKTKDSRQPATGNSKGILFIVSAPSGAGKTTLCRMAVDYFSDLRHSISYTTRPSREGEKNSIDYHFVSQQFFQKMLNNAEFLEWAEVHGNRYGTSRNDINALLEKGLDIILDIDVQGARQVKQRLLANSEQPAVFIFILPPSLKVCEERIKTRGKDSPEVIAGRLENARTEIRESIKYDFIIINDNLEDAFERLKSIILAERSRRERMMGEVKRIYSEVLDL